MEHDSNKHANHSGHHHHHGDHENGHETSGHHGGHDHHKMINDFRKRFWISVVLSLPVLLISPMIQEFLGYTLEFRGSRYVLFGLSSFIFGYGGWPFLKGLVSELRERNPGMMTLIAVAISVAYLYSSAVVFGLTGKLFFWELVTLIDVMLVGHWIEMRSVLGASRSLEKLAELLPAEAHRVNNGDVEDVPVSALKKGDILLIRPGEKIPTDGIIRDGESYVNESMLTGESEPVKKTSGDEVIGGSINGKGSIEISAVGVGEDSYLNKVVNLVREAQKVKSKTQNLADKAARWLTFISLTVGVATLSVWLTLGYDLAYAIERMVTVMVISCPHALGLAIPLVVAISTSVSAQNGLLIRNRTAFENSRKISTLLFDKTGTLTKGEFGVTRFVAFDQGTDKNEILRLASALERKSEHLIAQGVVRKARELDLDIPDADDFESITGKGVSGNVEGKNVKVVSPGYLTENDLSVPEEALDNKAETVVFVLVDDQPAGLIALADEIRPESGNAIKRFRENNIRVVMATGDNERVARAVSEELGLDDFYAEVLPDEKQKIIKELQENGEFVAMTGDGVNDAPALAQADVGIAVGSGTDVAAETADIILVNSNPEDILHLILFGRKTYRKMIQNLVWATGYNAIAIPLAAGVLYSIGIMPGPAVGAVFMSLSTVIVAINAQLLRNQIKT